MDVGLSHTAEALSVPAAKRISGFYGKLPAHGDFIDRGLPVGFINGWDQWLQQSVSASREQYGESWLDIYLTSPIWRFALTAGVIDNRAWAGILVPSVDRVGRYFPITIAMPLAADERPATFLAENEDLFSHWEQVALQALQESLVADEVDERLVRAVEALKPANGVAFNRNSLIRGVAQPDDRGNGWARMVDAGLSLHDDSFSLWRCAGSANMPPMMLFKKGLPEPRSFTAMLSGQWQACDWDAP
ncbi:type VI secretion system-associated protein TagF [Parendozoicomonas haliclonae]|uniref:Type VI secretion system-associated protein TagF n=1 Tax=Parendozoicomonas haliclonae TaxID=1960125 RepID=A0A1X7AR82_9GAMM|nr:type VI secretion system-associated protein TagF [Parendozoicomonas haliclonae]SMA50663.1 hypothetical protein EHSB41UT_04480 [Parendozoicomonas haliclonae]